MFAVLVDDFDEYEWSPVFDSLAQAVTHYTTVICQIGDWCNAEHDPTFYRAQFDYGQHGDTVSIVHYQLKAELEAAAKDANSTRCSLDMILQYTVRRDQVCYYSGKCDSTAEPAKPSKPAKLSKLRKSQQASQTKLYVPKPTGQTK